MAKHTYLGQIHGNLCAEKWKYSIEIWRHFVLSDGFALYFDQFENGFNHCCRKIVNNTTCLVLLTDFDV